MRVFGLFFCVAATALIIPKDAEDRILYTILCKPCLLYTSRCV